MAEHRMKRVRQLFEGDKMTRIPKPETFDTFAIHPVLIEHELNDVGRTENVYRGSRVAPRISKTSNVLFKVAQDLKIEEKSMASKEMGIQGSHK
jgi:hypothetical protein